jgi:Domain of unknown function (DUF1707)
MDTPIMSFPRGDVRVSDAERDRAVAELSEHYQAGRLTAGELEDRSGRALQARTGAELSDLFTDLPEPAVSATGTRAVSAVTSRPRSRPSLRSARIVFLCMVAAIVTGLVLTGHRAGHNVGFGLPIPGSGGG